MSGERSSTHPTAPVPIPYRETGKTLWDLLTVLALIALIAGLALPAVRHWYADYQMTTAAGNLVQLFRGLRFRAVTRHRYLGVVFESAPDGWRYTVYEDGNGNGIRRRDIRQGRDRAVQDRRPLSTLLGNVRTGYLPGRDLPAVPPQTGTLETDRDPIRFGADIVSFSPRGNSSSGTIYLTDGSQRMMAVVIYGPTIRIRRWEYQPQARTWTRR